MPELYDVEEAIRLHEDAAAMVREAGSGTTDHNPTAQAIYEELVATNPEAERCFREFVDRRTRFYEEVAGAWAMFKEGMDERSMAKIRGAHAAIRTIVMRELPQG